MQRARILGFEAGILLLLVLSSRFDFASLFDLVGLVCSEFLLRVQFNPSVGSEVSSWGLCLPNLVVFYLPQAQKNVSFFFFCPSRSGSKRKLGLVGGRRGRR
jgi:hypothetical protein